MFRLTIYSKEQIIQIFKDKQFMYLKQLYRMFFCRSFLNTAIIVPTSEPIGTPNIMYGIASNVPNGYKIPTQIIRKLYEIPLMDFRDSCLLTNSFCRFAAAFVFFSNFEFIFQKITYFSNRRLKDHDKFIYIYFFSKQI